MAWTLEDLRDKLRNLTGRQDLSDAECDNALNNYYLYTFPMDVKPPELQTFWEFDTVSGTATYTPDDSYSSIPGNPTYVEGVKVKMWTNPGDFYDYWPQTAIFTPARPTSALLFGGSLTLAPTPNEAYEVKVLAWLRPTELVSNTDEPLKPEWGPCIAYGAAMEMLLDVDDPVRNQSVAAGFERHRSAAMDRYWSQQSGQCVTPGI